jgi:hypothetical protein
MEPDLVIHSNDISPKNVLPQITKVAYMLKLWRSEYNRQRQTNIKDVVDMDASVIYPTEHEHPLVVF